MNSPSIKKKYESWNHVILENVFTSANLLPTYLEGKIQASTSAAFA
jgi:hypothetical protein